MDNKIKWEYNLLIKNEGNRLSNNLIRNLNDFENNLYDLKGISKKYDENKLKEVGNKLNELKDKIYEFMKDLELKEVE